MCWYNAWMTEPAGARSLRARLTTALELPARWLQDRMDLDHCPHAGLHDTLDPRCRLCAQGEECRWLGGHETGADLASRTEAELIEALEFCHASVDAALSQAGHTVRTCRCEGCRWLRGAERLLHRADERQAGDREATGDRSGGE